MPVLMEVPGRFEIEEEDPNPFESKDVLLKKLYLKMDEMLQQRFSFEGEWNRSLHRNGTKVVHLKGKESGKDYRIVYKFGRVVQAEYFGAQVLSQFGLPVPKMYYKPGASHLWIQYQENDFPVERLLNRLGIILTRRWRNFFIK